MLQKEVDAHGRRAGHRRIRPSVGDAAVPFQHGTAVRCAAGRFPAGAESDVEHRPHGAAAGLRCAADDYALLGKVVTAAFGQRRKTLRNTLRDYLDEADFAAVGIDPGLRGERLTVDDFVRIANHVARRPPLPDVQVDATRPGHRARRCSAGCCGAIVLRSSSFFVGQVLMPSSG